MPILSTNHLTHAFGADDLLQDLSLKLEAKERVGLVGRNGVGKTTLLLILAGLLEPDEGDIHRQNDLTLGYLRQEAVLTFAGQENSIYEEMLSVFADLTALEARMRQLEERMAAGETAEALFDEYGQLQTDYEVGGGYAYQVDIKRVLLGLGFPEASWQTPLNHLSGGQKTRVLLGRLLLEKPDLLILDEPTNHLDQAALEWLEKTLRQWPKALLIVSHDRYFLDKVITHVWEMTAEQIKRYKGNYSTFVQQRQTELDHERRLWEEEKARLESELDFIRKHIAGGKTDIAKGKLKRLTRDIVLLEEVGILERQNKSWLLIGGRVRTLSANEAQRRLRDLQPPQAPPTLNIKLRSAMRSGRLVLRTSRLQIGYPPTPLFSTGKIQLERADIAALIGDNGSGKTTFLRTLTGHLAPLAGEIEYGENVQLGYFAQAHDQLDHEQQVLEALLAQRPSSEQEARNYLAQYLFRGHDVFKKVGDLSGGERGRLALAILAASGANFLLLDEPTNHLDIPAQEAVQTVLERFDGTILLVSHDRYLIQQLATQIWSLEADGQLHIFEGSYEEFLAQRAQPPPVEPTVAYGNLMSDPIDEAAPPDLGWLETLAEPSPQKKRRGPSEADLALRDATIWLERIAQELAEARAAGDADQIAWLEEEYALAQSDLEELQAQLDGD